MKTDSRNQKRTGTNLRPRNWEAEAKAFLAEYLRVIRDQFYLDDQRRFYPQKHLLIQAITWPERMMLRMGVFLPFDRQREILNEIIQGIKRHGDTARINHFAGYFLHCVQTYVKIRTDVLYQEAKAAAAKQVSSLPLEAILQGVQIQEGISEARAAELLVELADQVRPKRRPKKPAKTQDPQLGLGL